jgi:hypothetical protein
MNGDFWASIQKMWISKDTKKRLNEQVIGAESVIYNPEEERCWMNILMFTLGQEIVRGYRHKRPFVS